MTLELLILIVVFVLVPLYQQWQWTVRQRGVSKGAQASTAPPRQPPPRLPPRRAAMLPDTLAAATERASAPLSPAPARVADGTATVPPRRIRMRSAGLGSRLALRRAVVLSTILGPCRAVDPYN